MRSPQSKLFCFAFIGTLWSLQPAASFSQALSGESAVIPLTLEAGVPLRVVLERPVPIKKAGVAVEARLAEPVFAFDHLVVPAGSRVLGRVAEVEEASRRERALAAAAGDFTPPRKVRLDFDTLVLSDGVRVPLHTTVSKGTANVVHLEAGGNEHESKKKSAGAAAAKARQEIKMREQAVVSAVQAPGKVDRLEKHLKAMAAAELPYHRQSLPAGTHFTAELTAPLQFGTENISAAALARLGAEVPSGSTVHVRLVTDLSSARDHQGKAVRAVVTEPVFSSDHFLILPEGTQLAGSVTEAIAARKLGRNGRLRFTFQRVDLPSGAAQKIEASLQAVEVPEADHLQLDSEGGAHAVSSKTRFIAPAIQVLLAASSMDVEHDGASAGAGSVEGDALGSDAVRGGSGLGLVGTLVALAVHSQPVTAGFAVYGATRSVYSHVLARGSEVVFPRDTAMEIRFGTHREPSQSGSSSHFSEQNARRNPS